MSGADPEGSPTFRGIWSNTKPAISVERFGSLLDIASAFEPSNLSTYLMIYNGIKLLQRKFRKHGILRRSPP